MLKIGRLLRIICIVLLFTFIFSFSIKSAEKEQGQQDNTNNGRQEDENDRIVRLFNLKADRKLSPEENTKMEFLIAVLLDKNASKIPIEVPNPLYRGDRIRFRRRAAAKVLGIEIAHSKAAAPLISVATDTKEHLEMRYSAITALSRIADKSVIPVLLDLLNDDEVDLRGRAYEQLDKLKVGPESSDPEVEYPMGQVFGYSFRSSPGLRIEAIQKWRDWWKANQKSFEFKRERAMFDR